MCMSSPVTSSSSLYCAHSRCVLNEDSIHCAPKFWASAVIGISMQKHFSNKSNLMWHVFSSYLPNSASEDVCTSFLSFYKLFKLEV